MIKKNDLFILLIELQEKGDTEAGKYINQLYKTTETPINIIKYINDKRLLDVNSFYEKLRKSYNKKKSNLYINIVKEIEDIEEVLTTLSAYNLQVLLFSRKLENKDLFFRSSRVEEVTRVLNNYYKTYNIEDCYKVISLIKADIKLFEYINIK